MKDWPRIHVVRCGLCEEFKNATPTPVPDVPRIVCVARFVEQKGHLVLIEAIDRLVREAIDIEVDLVGDGPLRTAIESEIRARGIEDHVHLLGWKNSDQVRQIVEASRALVLPSFAEGLPVSLMEAMALARPVIATLVGAVGELIDDRVHGWLVAAGSVEELTDAMRRRWMRRSRDCGRWDAREENACFSDMTPIAKHTNWRRSSWMRKGGTDERDRQAPAGDRLRPQRNEVHRGIAPETWAGRAPRRNGRRWNCDLVHGRQFRRVAMGRGKTQDSIWRDPPPGAASAARDPIADDVHGTVVGFHRAAHSVCDE